MRGKVWMRCCDGKGFWYATRLSKDYKDYLLLSPNNVKWPKCQVMWNNDLHGRHLVHTGVQQSILCQGQTITAYGLYLLSNIDCSMYNACLTLRDFLTKIVIKIITLVQSAYLYAAAADVDFHLDVGFSFSK